MTELKRKYRGALRIVSLREQAKELIKLQEELYSKEEQFQLNHTRSDYYEMYDYFRIEEDNLKLKEENLLREAEALGERAYKEIYFLLYQEYPNKNPYQGPNRRGTYRKNNATYFWLTQDSLGKRDSK